MNFKNQLSRSITLLPLLYIIGLEQAGATSISDNCASVGITCEDFIVLSGNTATVYAWCNSPPAIAHATWTNLTNIIITPYPTPTTDNCVTLLPPGYTSPPPGVSPSCTVAYGPLTKAASGQSSHFDMVLTFNNSATCTVDPFFTTLVINTGRAVVQTFSDVAKAVHFITVTNGAPGLNRLAIRVNGKDFKTLDLDGAASVINVDATSVMTEDKNTISFIGRGDLGSFANIVVADTAPVASNSFTSAVSGNAQRNAGIWGPLVDSVEDNASDQAAIAAKQQIQLSLAASLDLSSAVTASNYVVTVNGSTVSYLQVSATPSADGTTLVLRLPTRSFVAGNTIQVNWSGLKNSKGQLLSGHLDLIAQ
jgi:hypothetical protein